MKQRHLISKKLMIGVAVAVFWLAVWFLLAWIVDKELLLPHPQTVLLKLCELCVTPLFWKNVALSLLRILLGIVLALLLGTGLAILTSCFRFIDRLAYPLITVIRATPVASFIILALIWLGAGRLPVFICFLMVLPIVWSAISDGIRALDPKLVQICRVYRFSVARRFKLFYIPSILPYFLSACKTSIGLAWKAGVAAEVLAVTPISIGKQLYNAKLYLETSELFAWTTVVIILSLTIEKFTSYMIGKIGKRRTHAES